jgi:signal transduction histidine kinase
VAIYSRAPYEFSAEEISSVASLASQAAIAIHNARLYAEVEKQSRELAALFDVTAAATQSLEMDRILDEVIRRINEIFLFDATRFYLFDDQAEWLHCRATHQVNSIFLTRTFSFKKGQGITGRVGATGAAIIFNDTQASPQYQVLSQSKKAGQRFLAGFPVKYESETLGVIMCMGQHPRQLTSHEIDLITSLSSQIAVAVANARLYEQTKDQAEQLRNLAMRIESVREQERRIISREIHDELGQTLTALKFDASWIRGKLSNFQPALADRLAEMSAMIDNTIQAIREIAARLRPDILDKLGLTAAMEWQLQDFRKHTGIQYHLTADPLSIHLDEQQATTLFRILQESLANVARHSHATRVHIDLEQPAGEVFLRVEDDGDGIDNEKIFDTQSLGLLGMRERAVALGGNVTVERNLNRGTTLTAHLPIDRKIEAGAFLSRSEPI